ncbi:VirK/YbjX family protein [Selenomonas ruminantium]|nr:VirK/YbjX family protein [Selenomonas ruminantium]
MKLNYAEIGKKIYNLENPREYHRYLVFRVRCMLHPYRMQRLEKIFKSSRLLEEVANCYPFVYEQPTRGFFYNNSTFEERVALLEQHMTFLSEKIKENHFIDLYTRTPKILWESNDDGEKLRLYLFYHPGQRKEGLLSIVLDCPRGELYQMIFWMAEDEHGDQSLWIGAMQGPRMENAREIVKQITKRCHAYRTKNLILHATQEVARNLGLKHIYAVTNYGYYAMNHIRRDRKLKTSFSDFWMESGGVACKDKRFYELPMKERRKSMEEVPTRKRANYRKRYALLDEIDAAIETSILNLCK